jgi:hypothetical protein
MIDNLELIKPLLNFVEKGDFYMLYILKRKKDQPESERDNHQSVRNIKTYCVDSLDYLDKRWEEIKMLCEVFKARSYIHIQKQNHFDVSLEMMVELAQRIKNDVNNQKGLFDSVVGKIKTLEKRWIVDIDSKDEDYINSVLKFINSLNPIENKLISKIPTKSGFHLITRKFDLSEFSKKYPEIDVQKKNPTLLFLPNSLI